MATEDEDHAAFNDDEDDLEDTDDTDMEDFDDDDHNDNDVEPPLPPSPPPPTSADLHPPNPNPNPGSIIDKSFSDQNGAIQITPISSSAVFAGGCEQTRRLFQRLWTDDDEIKILKGFLEFTSLRGTTFASHQYDTGPFYEQIKNELQLDFNKNQLIEKLRRLKKKYRNTANRMASHDSRFSFKTPHEMETYEIAKKIWSASIVKSRESDEDDVLNNSYSNNNMNSNSDATMSSSRSRRRNSDATMSLSRSRRRNSDATMSLSRSRRRGLKRSLETPTALPLPPPPPPPPASENVVKVEVLTAPVTTPTPIPSPMIQEASNSNCNNAATPSIPSVIEDTVKSCLSPIFKELLNSAVNLAVGGSANFGGLGIKLPPLLNFGVELGEFASDERWKKQRILELEVYLKRVELVREQIRTTLDELKGSQTEPALES